jgi:hypothetical protein
MSDKVVVHDRIGVHGQKVLIDDSSTLDIPEEFKDDLNKIEQYQEELTNFRLEIGRLTQVMSQLTFGCNLAEKNLADAKKRILDSLKVSEGNWAIDLENKKIGKVINDDRKPHRVV